MEKASPKLIRQWLDADGRKIKWLASQVGADRPTVSRWLNGKQMPRLDHRRKLQDVTGLPVEHEAGWI